MTDRRDYKEEVEIQGDDELNSEEEDEMLAEEEDDDNFHYFMESEQIRSNLIKYAQHNALPLCEYLNVEMFHDFIDNNL